MTITIKFRDVPDGDAFTGVGTKVFNESGEEIKSITKIDIHIEPDAVVTAVVDVAVNSKTEMANIHALLGTKTLEDILKLHGLEARVIQKIDSETGD